jgi:16S rRNA (cytosine1402-N4)-methyltransferase
MYQHQSVLLKEAVDALVTRVDGLYVDGTFGRGGHSRAILERLSPAGRLLVVDKDPEAIEVARALQADDTRVEIHQGSFADLAQVIADKFGVSRVCGVLLDLGVSSPQLDDATRGFSFQQDGPLDMRMDTSRGQSAAEWLQTASEEEIADVMYQYGEERFSRRMARAIVNARAETPIVGTLQLAAIVKEANPAWEKHKHPATRAFQGIRIFINSELQDLQRALDLFLELLETNGRLVVISFHSLEDRIVKQFMQKHVKGDDFPPGVPVRQDQLKPRLKLVGKAMKGSAGEDASENNRARSAVMRVAEKLA